MNAIKAFPGITGLFPIKITNNPDLQEILTENLPILRILVNLENPGSDKVEINAMNAIKAFPGITRLFPIKTINNPDLQEILTESIPILRILVNPENPGSDKVEIK